MSANKVTIGGQSGEVRWGYHCAATLGQWTVADSTLTATVVNHDAFKVAQAPLMFVVDRPRGQQWRWPVVSLSTDGSTLTATLGPVE